MAETWTAGLMPVQVWEPTGGVTRRGPEIAPARTEREWAAWPIGDPSRAVFCGSKAEARAVAYRQNHAAAPAAPEVPRAE